MSTNLTVACAAAVLSVVAPSALAHHSFAMFDANKTQTVSGTVKEYEWTNPHVWIRVMVLDATGEELEWGIEMASPAQQVRRGWSATTIKPGDKITVTVHPLKDGSRGGQLMTVVFSGGELPINPRQARE